MNPGYWRLRAIAPCDKIRAMSRTQDKFEKTLKQIHVLFGESPVYPVDPDKVLVDKKKVFQLLNQLNVYVYQLMDEGEVTDAAKDRMKREAVRKGDKIISEATKKSEAVYAASVMYTSEALTHIQNEISKANDAINDILSRASAEFEQQMKTIKANKNELTEQLQDMADAKTYLRIIDEKRSEAERKAMLLKKEKEKAETDSQAKKPSSGPEIKINSEYFEKTGTSMSEVYGDDEKSEPEPKIAPEITVNLDAEYFKWKQDQSSDSKSDPESEKKAT